MNSQEWAGLMMAKITSIQKEITRIEQLLTTPNGGNAPRVVYKPVIVGVNDISSIQLYYAYKKGLNMEQLYQFADGKYTPEQIYKKLKKFEVQ